MQGQIRRDAGYAHGSPVRVQWLVQRARLRDDAKGLGGHQIMYQACVHSNMAARGLLGQYIVTNTQCDVMLGF